MSVEHSPDNKDETASGIPTDREKSLRKWYAKNVEEKLL